MKYRKNIRLKNYDYSSNGYYFVTINCSCRAKLCLEHKKIIEKHLKNLEKREGVKLDYFTVMPNHIHFILIQDGAVAVAAERSSAEEGEGKAGALRLQGEGKAGALRLLPLCRYIQDFKSKTTLEIKKLGFTGKHFWQPNYYEHIIRNEKALYAIRKYIQDNPDVEKLNFEQFYEKK